MANLYGSAVSFTKELNVWTLMARVRFGANIGSNNVEVVLDQPNSKGICNVTWDTVTFTGGTLGSSTTMGSMSSFADLFGGMTVSGGTAGDLQSATTISSFSAAGQSIVLSKQAIATNTGGTYFATGGRVRFQFGTQAALRVTPFVKLLGMQISWDESSGSASGSVSALQLAPSTPVAFIVDNNISVKTIPQTTTSGSTDASIVVQFGYGQGPGTGFQAANPQPGEVARVVFFLGNNREGNSSGT